jgi:hypothetical protein
VSRAPTTAPCVREGRSSINMNGRCEQRTRMVVCAAAGAPLTLASQEAGGRGAAARIQAGVLGVGKHGLLRMVGAVAQLGCRKRLRTRLRTATSLATCAWRAVASHGAVHDGDQAPDLPEYVVPT